MTVRSLKRNPKSPPAVWCLLRLKTCSFFHELGHGCACACARVLDACVCVCSRLSRRLLQELKERPDEHSALWSSIPALWVVLPSSIWTFFHEMGARCVCVRARVHVCGHCIALIRRFPSLTQNVLLVV